jgi:hypothetical protein
MTTPYIEKNDYLKAENTIFRKKMSTEELSNHGRYPETPGYRFHGA